MLVFACQAQLCIVLKQRWLFHVVQFQQVVFGVYMVAVKIAPNYNFLKYPFRSSLVRSQYRFDGLTEYCPSDSHLVAAVISKPEWCSKETCCIPLPPTQCHLLASTCRMKLFYEEVIFSKCKTGISTSINEPVNFGARFFNLLLLSCPCFGYKPSLVCINNSVIPLCLQV